MIFRSLKYYVVQAGKSLARNKLMTITSIITVFSCVLILVMSYSVGTNIQYILDGIEDSIGFTVFVNDEVTASELTDALTKMENNQYIESVTYVSQEDALESFRENLGEKAYILDGMESDNPLPRSFDIIPVSSDNNAALVEEFTKYTGEGKIFSSIKYAKEETQVLSSINKVIRYMSIGLILTLGFISVVIIMNTIRVAVSSRKTEINIMKYVGATDWFIRWPFILEGVFIGVIGSLLPVIICASVYNKVVSIIYSTVPFLQNIVSFKSVGTVYIGILPVALFMGIGLGVIGSVACIARHLDV